MSDLQQFIYSLEVGSIRAWMSRAAVMVSLLLLAGFYMITQFNGLAEPAAFEQAQIAREIGRGHGFSTQLLRPVVLKKLREHMDKPEQMDVARVPDTLNAPLYPTLLAAALKVTGTTYQIPVDEIKNHPVYPAERVIVFVNFLLILAASIFFYLWMLRAFDNRVALLASALFILTDALWSAGISGVASPLAIFLFCVLGFFLNEALLADDAEQNGLALVHLALAAAAIGLAALTRYSYFFLVVPFALVAFFVFNRRIPALAIAIGVPLLMLAPWLARNFQVTGNIFGHSWMYWFAENGRLPGEAFWRSYGPESAAAIGVRPLLRVLIGGSIMQLQQLPSLLGGLTATVFFLVCIFHSFRRPHVQNGRWFWIGAFFAILAAAAPAVRDPASSPDENALLPLLPVFAGFGSAFFFILLERLSLPSRILQYPLIFAVAFVQFLPLGLRLVQHRATPFAYPPYFPPIFFYTQPWLQKDDFIASDIPWATAWYYDFPTLWLPYTLNDYYEIDSHVHSISVMLLTPYSTNRHFYGDMQNGEYKDWAGIITRTDFQKTPLPIFQPLPPNKPGDYLYLTNKRRW